MWLDESGRSVASLALEVGVTSQAVYMWCRGSRVPSGAHIAKIEELSSGQVTARSFVEVMSNEADRVA